MYIGIRLHVCPSWHGIGAAGNKTRLISSAQNIKSQLTKNANNGTHAVQIFSFPPSTPHHHIHHNISTNTTNESNGNHRTHWNNRSSSSSSGRQQSLQLRMGHFRTIFEMGTPRLSRLGLRIRPFNISILTREFILTAPHLTITSTIT